MRIRKPQRGVVMAVVVTVAGLGYAASASTLFAPDSDTAALVSIVANGLNQLNVLNQHLGEAKKAYQTTKEMAGYAADAAKVADSLMHLDTGPLEDMLVAAVPNAGFFDREIRYGGYKNWGQGTGQLQLMMRMCLNYAQGRMPKDGIDGVLVTGDPNTKVGTVEGGPLMQPGNPCSVLNDQLTGREIALSFEQLFGSKTTPEHAVAAREALLQADLQRARDARQAETMKVLKAYCRNAPTSAEAAKAAQANCQAAAQAAQFLSAEQLIQLTDRMSEMNTVAARRLALQVAEREQRRQELDEQGLLLRNAAERLQGPGPTWTAPGPGVQ
jgi:hypothetical protein